MPREEDFFPVGEKPQHFFFFSVLQFFTNAGKFLRNVKKFPKYLIFQVVH